MTPPPVLSALKRGEERIDVSDINPLFPPSKPDLPATVDREQNDTPVNEANYINILRIAPRCVDDLAENTVLLLQSGDLFLKITDALRWS